MRIFWVSVSPDAATGYGRVTREVVSRLLDRHEVICIGHSADVIVWGGRRYVRLPNGREVLTLSMTNPLIDEKSCLEIIKAYVSRFKPDLLIAHWDAMAISVFPRAGLPSICYVPIDGYMTYKWSQYLKDYYLIVTYSMFGYNQLLRYFPPSRVRMIYHGIDTDRFKPLRISREELISEINKLYTPPIPEDAFIITNVAANIGPRKNIPLLLRAFKKFSEEHRDAHLILHTNLYARMGRGYDLPMIIDELGIKDRVHYPVINPILYGYDDEDMVKLYNVTDVYVSLSVAEGFGYPILEAMSCGTPVIAPRNSSHVELIEGHGWLVDNIPEDEYVIYPVYVPYGTIYPAPSIKSFLEKLEEAYSDDGLREKYGRLSREFSLQFDWRLIMPKWFKLLDEIEDDISILRSIIE